MLPFAERCIQRLPSEYLKSNFSVTTSGNFSPPAFACTLDVMGADRVMLSADDPMDDGARAQVAGANALPLFGDRIPLS